LYNGTEWNCMHQNHLAHSSAVRYRGGFPPHRGEAVRGFQRGKTQCIDQRVWEPRWSCVFLLERSDCSLVSRVFARRIRAFRLRPRSRKHASSAVVSYRHWVPTCYTRRGEWIARRQSRYGDFKGACFSNGRPANNFRVSQLRFRIINMYVLFVEHTNKSARNVFPDESPICVLGRVWSMAG